MNKLENHDSLLLCAKTMEALGRKSGSTEALAVDATNYLFNFLNQDSEDCALVRFFRTMAYGELTPHLQDLVQQDLNKEPDHRTNCLTLMASRGSQPEWNDRFASTGHQVIPLTSLQMVESAPMISQLVKRLGLNINNVVDPAPILFLNPQEKLYPVMYVEDAVGDSAIVAQESFVIPYKIRSVIGFGGLLPTGDMFAVLMFLKVFVTPDSAKNTGSLARSLENAINQIRSGKKTRAKIMIADDAEGWKRLSKLLGPDHDIFVASTIEEGIKAAESEGFDLIVCGTQFDQSRMFDLLKAMKKDKRQKLKPFICFRNKDSFLGNETQLGVSKASVLSGAACFLDASNMTDSDLLTTVEAYLPEDIWMSKDA